jgi:CRISPR-associated protein Csm4
MKSLKVNIKPVGSFSTPLQSDTFFGLFCWTFLYKFGEEKLNQLLSEFSTKPFIIFSNGFEHGKLPIPILEPVEVSPYDLEFNKSIKTNRFMDGNDLLKLKKDSGRLNGKLIRDYLIEKARKDKDGLNANPTKEILEKKKESAIFLRNSINRNSDTVKDGLLYSTEETFYSENTSFDIYIKYDESLIKFKEINDTLKSMGQYGYGKDKSTGKGHFTLKEDIQEKFEEQDFLHPRGDKEKYFFTLSNGFHSKETDSSIELLYGKTFTKFPKMSGTYAANGKYLKNPIVLFESGSSFEVQQQKEYYGFATNDVFSDSDLYKDHYHSGYMIPFFFDYMERQ